MESGTITKKCCRNAACGRESRLITDDSGTRDLVKIVVEMAEIAAALTKPVLHRILAY